MFLTICRLTGGVSIPERTEDEKCITSGRRSPDGVRAAVRAEREKNFRNSAHLFVLFLLVKIALYRGT